MCQSNNVIYPGINEQYSNLQELKCPINLISLFSAKVTRLASLCRCEVSVCSPEALHHAPKKRWSKRLSLTRKESVIGEGCKTCTVPEVTIECWTPLGLKKIPGSVAIAQKSNVHAHLRCQISIFPAIHYHHCIEV